MRKIITYLVAVFVVLSFSGIATAEQTATINLELGVVETYTFDDMTVYAYQANDGLGDETILIQTGDSLIAIDVPSFTAQLDEMDSFIAGFDMEITDLVLAYHPFGGDRYENATVYMSQYLVNAAENPDMGANFSAAFGDSFVRSVPKADVTLTEGEVTIGGVDMILYPTADGCDIAIPAINTIFMHMNGGTTHSIIHSVEEIDELTAKLNQYATAGYDFVFTSHDPVEPASALTDKINYLKQVKEIAKTSVDADSFINAMNEAFPDYGGANYLGMTAGNLFGA